MCACACSRMFVRETPTTCVCVCVWYAGNLICVRAARFVFAQLFVLRHVWSVCACACVSPSMQHGYDGPVLDD